MVRRSGAGALRAARGSLLGTRSCPSSLRSGHELKHRGLLPRAVLGLQLHSGWGVVVAERPGAQRRGFSRGYSARRGFRDRMRAVLGPSVRGVAAGSSRDEGDKGCAREHVLSMNRDEPRSRSTAPWGLCGYLRQDKAPYHDVIFYTIRGRRIRSPVWPEGGVTS